MAKPGRKPYKSATKTQRRTLRRINRNEDTDRSLKLSQSLSANYSINPTPATPPAVTKAVTPLDSAFEQINRISDSLNKIRTAIDATRANLIECPPNEPAHRSLINQLQQLWADYTGLTNEFIRITAV